MTGAEGGAESPGLRARIVVDREHFAVDVGLQVAVGETMAIMGPSGAGKSTLLGLISGTVEPTVGRVKRGTTVKVQTLTQRLDELTAHWNDPVRVIISGLRTSYTMGAGSKAQDLTPGQLLERLGFDSAQLSTPVKDLSGGQQRRLQLLLVLVDQPNVLILDEPTNDLDTDMLAAIEDLLDSWSGTLLVVSHDRYFLERVTDQQYAILDGHLRHLPGGVDEYLRLRELQSSTGSKQTATAAATATTAASTKGLDGAALRAAQKEISALERRIQKLTQQVNAAKTALADHDQSDYAGLGDRMKKISEQQAEIEELELRWFELTEEIG